ncbi:IucA/IucC family protein [Thalassospira lucentensis]|uniref:IucA/IucC family protein n=1 Tax=Thalassospira lucentensis TaxID=168935 RepID=UPI0003B697AE|nr:IucA/IucC family protein [Thalassospira lucentensis]RCK27804.1 AcsC protein [Thalassospira lucentensis MCCC 1A00383 = DSM 14000]
MNVNTLPFPRERETPGTAIYSWISSQNRDCFVRVEQRVLKQLVQTLIFEKVVPVRTQETDNGTLFLIEGRSLDDATVIYLFEGQRKESFGQIKLSGIARRQCVDAHQTTDASLTGFMEEVLSHIPGTINLTQFIEELEQTLIKDVQSLSQPIPADLSAFRHDYNSLEGLIMDAHSYHACYKSRIGFSLAENAAYGPEFRQDIHLVWLAIRKDHADIGLSRSYDYASVIQEQLAPSDFEHFETVLRDNKLTFDDVRLLPVHPWQWDKKLVTAFHREIRDGILIYLGRGSDAYHAQQSIRTLANVSAPDRPYLKVAMHLTNTSSTRILANHTVRNGPVITDWLQHLIENDKTAGEMDFVILREFLGVSFDYETLPEHRRTTAYGGLGSVWRESMAKYLRPGEAAIPFNGLTHIQRNGKPITDDWIQAHGREEWSAQLIQVAVRPIIYLLLAEGVGLESHGQNIVLIHKDGWPVRIALKDFHDGVRYCPDALAHPDKAPKLHAAPASHLRLNRNSFIITDDLNAVRDFTCDAFFFICLAEIGIFLDSNYGLAEQWFWKTTAGVIREYQEQNPQHAERYQCFDVFAPTIQVEELTRRRLFGDSEPRFMDVANPLYAYRP